MCSPREWPRESNQKDQLEKVINIDSNISYIYGPYSGDTIITLSISQREVEFNDLLESKTIDGLDLSYKKIDHYLLIYTRHNGLSYSSEGRITREYTEERYLKMLTEAVVESTS